MEEKKEVKKRVRKRSPKKAVSEFSSVDNVDRCSESENKKRTDKFVSLVKKLDLYVCELQSDICELQIANEGVEAEKTALRHMQWTAIGLCAISMFIATLQLYTFVR